MVIDCLIIIKPWLEKILSGEKTWRLEGAALIKEELLV